MSQAEEVLTTQVDCILSYTLEVAQTDPHGLSNVDVAHLPKADEIVPFKVSLPVFSSFSGFASSNNFFNMLVLERRASVKRPNGPIRESGRKGGGGLQ